MNIQISNLTIKKMPRLRGENASVYYCWDDCIATYANYVKLPYTNMYFEALGCSYTARDPKVRTSIGSRIEAYNNFIPSLKQYGNIEMIPVKLQDEDFKLEIIRELEKQSPVLIFMNAYHCPWDWRFGEIEDGEHAFLIHGYNEEENCYLCTDPYYNRQEEKLPMNHFQQGCHTLYRFEVKQENKREERLHTLTSMANNMLSNSYDSQLIAAANEIKTSFDILIELKGYSKEMEITYDYVKDNLTIYQVITNISVNRVRYAVLLNDLATQYPSYAIQLKDYERGIVEIAEKWESMHFMLIKRVLSQDETVISDYLYSKIVALVEEEKKLLFNISQLENQDVYHCVSKPKKEVKKIKNIEFVDIINVCNHQEIGTLESHHVKRNNLGKYFLADLFSKEQMIKYKQFKFRLTHVFEDLPDNITCQGQSIQLNEGHYQCIMLLSCSEWGDMKEDISIEYACDTKATYTADFYDWLPDLSKGEPRYCAYKSKVVEQIDSTNYHMSDLEHRLYATLIPVDEEKLLKAITLPVCPYIHIFSISLGK